MTRPKRNSRRRKGTPTGYQHRQQAGVQTKSEPVKLSIPTRLGDAQRQIAKHGTHKSKMPSWGTQLRCRSSRDKTNFVSETTAKDTRSDNELSRIRINEEQRQKVQQWCWQKVWALDCEQEQIGDDLGLKSRSNMRTDIRERTTNCTRDGTKMSTAPTTHDTPNENAHRMGARIKSNRLGSISKTSASATRMAYWIPLRRMQKPQPNFPEREWKEQTPSDFNHDTGRNEVRSAAEIKIRGRTTRPTKIMWMRICRRSRAKDSAAETTGNKRVKTEPSELDKQRAGQHERNEEKECSRECSHTKTEFQYAKVVKDCAHE